MKETKIADKTPQVFLKKMSEQEMLDCLEKTGTTVCTIATVFRFLHSLIGAEGFDIEGEAEYSIDPGCKLFATSQGEGRYGFHMELEAGATSDNWNRFIRHTGFYPSPVCA